jgi:hypothetical protein
MAAVDSLTVVYNCSGPGGFSLTSKTKFNIDALTAANFTATTAAAHALANACQGLTTAVVNKDSIAIDDSVGGDTYPTAVANRGQKWIITATNAAGQIFTYTIPAGDPGGGLGGPNVSSDNITYNPTATNWTGFAVAFNAVAVDRDGNGLTFQRAKLGGRRR